MQVAKELDAELTTIPSRDWPKGRHSEIASVGLLPCLWSTATQGECSLGPLVALPRAEKVQNLSTVRSFTDNSGVV